MIDLSIVIPCYNHGIYIGDALESVAKYQGKYRIEVIIVNDGSTDAHTKAVMEQLAGEGYQIIHQENKGLAAARNTGIAAAKGEYILPLDSDNKIYPDYIDKGIEVLERHSQVGVVYGDALYFGDKTGRWVVGNFDMRRLFDSNFIDACAVFRKRIWEEVGGYDENMPAMGWEDWDFWMRAVMEGWKFHYVPEVLFDYRVRDNSMIQTDTKPNMEKLNDYIFSKPVYYLARHYRAEIIAHNRYQSTLFLLRALWRKVSQKLLRR